eukprot:3294158-Prymnesium_polylepis.2
MPPRVCGSSTLAACPPRTAPPWLRSLTSTASSAAAPRWSRTTSSPSAPRWRRQRPPEWTSGSVGGPAQGRVPYHVHTLPDFAVQGVVVQSVCVNARSGVAEGGSGGEGYGDRRIATARGCYWDFRSQITPLPIAVCAEREGMANWGPRQPCGGAAGLEE